ncbi:MAG: molecular chaperone TorD family protein [Bacteroidales bacterium]|jgi:TorA maturation chaperone TorD|nr:molecular chaperone TorD family protein [Bacteroidales bacterium]
MDTNRETEVNNLLKGYNMMLYFAGSMIMYEPTEECITDFWSKGILRNLPVESRNPRFMEAASQLRGSCLDKATCRLLLMEDYSRLFTSPGYAVAVPLKSLWAPEDPEGDARDYDPGRFYESYGWKPKLRNRLPDDHLGTEILFLTLLTDKLASFDDEACRREMKKEIRKFIKDHIFSWVPQWNNMVQESAGSMCYKGISTLILACAEDIYALLDSDNDLYFSLNNLKN